MKQGLRGVTNSEQTGQLLAYIKSRNMLFSLDGNF